MARPPLRSAGLVLALSALATPVLAQGSSVYTQSACVSAQGHTGVAAPCLDASGVYYNPALLALMPSAVSAGFAAINNRGEFVYDTTGLVVEREATTPIVPQAYLSYRFGGQARLAAGFGAFAPYGLGIEWPQDFEGRFVSWKTRLRGLYLQPTLAYQLVPGRLAIGAGPQIVLGSIELNQHLDAADVAIPGTNLTLAQFGVNVGTDFASATLSGDGTGVGGHVGLYFQATDRLALGVRYMHRVKVDLSGDAEFDPIWNPNNILLLPFGPGGGTIPVPLDSLVVGALVDQTANASITFPPQTVVGFQYRATPRLSLSADYQWTGWSSFDEIVATFEGGNELVLTLNYEDTHTLRFGGTYDATPEWTIRGGFLYNTAASPDETVTPLLPEAERHLFSVGVGYRLGPVQADAFYNFINQADRRGRVRSQLPGGITGADLNVGVYSANVHLVGLTLSYLFHGRGAR